MATWRRRHRVDRVLISRGLALGLRAISFFFAFFSSLQPKPFFYAPSCSCSSSSLLILLLLLPLLSVVVVLVVVDVACRRRRTWRSVGGGRCGAWGRTVLDRTDFAKEAKSILEG